VSKIKANFLFFTKDKDGKRKDIYEEKEVASKRIVCDVCNGDGTHVNPAIDGNGITADEMHELGDDFRDSYMAGHFDVCCSECKGQNVIDVIDMEALSETDQAGYWAYKNEESQAYWESEYERQAGA